VYLETTVKKLLSEKFSSNKWSTHNGHYEIVNNTIIRIMMYLEVEAIESKNSGIAIAANSAASGPDPLVKCHVISKMVARLINVSFF